MDKLSIDTLFEIWTFVAIEDIEQLAFTSSLIYIAGKLRIAEYNKLRKYKVLEFRKHDDTASDIADYLDALVERPTIVQVTKKIIYHQYEWHEESRIRRFKPNSWWFKLLQLLSDAEDWDPLQRPLNAEFRNRRLRQLRRRLRSGQPYGNIDFIELFFLLLPNLTHFKCIDHFGLGEGISMDRWPMLEETQLSYTMQQRNRFRLTHQMLMLVSLNHLDLDGPYSISLLCQSILPNAPIALKTLRIDSSLITPQKLRHILDLYGETLLEFDLINPWTKFDDPPNSITSASGTSGTCTSYLQLFAEMVERHSKSLQRYKIVLQSGKHVIQAVKQDGVWRRIVVDEVNWDFRGTEIVLSE